MLSKTRRSLLLRQTKSVEHAAPCQSVADMCLQIDVSVNAPEAGTIKELLVNEGDTVTVGQEVAKLEPGEGGSGGKQEASSETKEPAPKEQSTTSDPEPKKEEEQKPKQEEQKKETPAPPKEDKAPPPKAEKKPPPPPPSEEKATSKKDEKKPEPSPFGTGSRGENRVRLLLRRRWRAILKDHR